MTSTNKLERLDELLWDSLRKSVSQKFYGQLLSKCLNEMVGGINGIEFRFRINNQLKSYEF